MFEPESLKSDATNLAHNCIIESETIQFRPSILFSRNGSERITCTLIEAIRSRNGVANVARRSYLWKRRERERERVKDNRRTDKNFQGADCSKSVCPVLCSSHGQYGGGMCHCEDGWKGAECDIPLGDCQVPDCNQHGQCVRGSCVCNPGWKGGFCDERKLKNMSGYYTM